MKKAFFYCTIAILAASCNIQSNSDNRYADQERKKYKLRLNPEPGSKYYFDMTNESEINMEVDDKKVENRNRSTVGVYYDIRKDSTGDFLFHMQYDKIKLYTKSNETETEMDAVHANVSINPIEKMLGAIKGASIVATIDPAGEIKEIKGYKEIGDRIIEGFEVNDTEGRAMALKQWEKMIGEGLIKKNMDQLFKIFPDSTVRIGDKWKLDSRQSGEINFDVQSFYKLKAINDDIAIIESEGEIKSEDTPTGMVRYNTVSNLQGQQQGTYEMNTKTGMLMNCKITSRVKGSIQMMGKEIPVGIKSSVEMNSKKLK